MVEIFKRFNPQTDITRDIQIRSLPLWSNNENPITSFYTSTVQTSVSGEYYKNVYAEDPDANLTAPIQFAVAYGHIDGDGSTGDPDSVDGTGDTPTKAIYSQYRNMLLPPADTIFTFGGVNSEDILVIDVVRGRYRQRVDPGNWEIEIGGTIYADSSGAADDPTVSLSHRVFNIYEKVDGVLDQSTVAGLFYPDAGIIMFSPSVLGLSSIDDLISGISSFSARSEERITCTHYFVRATNNEFNFTNNPTFVSGSNGKFAYDQMLYNPSVYITTIGLYDDQSRLIATAKLGQPRLKSFNEELLIRVRVNY